MKLFLISFFLGSAVTVLTYSFRTYLKAKAQAALAEVEKKA